MIFNFDELTDEQLEEYVEDFKKLPLKYFDYFPLVELFRKYYKTGFRDKEFSTNMNHLLTALNWEITRRQSNGGIKKLGYGKNHFLTCTDLEESTLIKKLDYAESRLKAYGETFSKSMCNEKHIKILYEKVDELVDAVNNLTQGKT